MDNAVYNRLMDDESRFIFENRCLYSLTGSNIYIRRIIETLPEYNILRNQWGKRPTYIFGAGKRGKFALENYDLNVIGFIDNDKNKQGETIEGKTVYNINDIDKNSNILITNLREYRIIESQLVDLGFEDGMVDNDLRVESFVIPKQYFDLFYLRHDPEEIFVDAGALNGDTSMYFIKWSGGIFRTIFCFEPDKNSYKTCVERLAFLKDRVVAINKGLWSSVEELSFYEGLGGSSRIDREGRTVVSVTTLDQELNKSRVTFIKMDIEGAEIPALKGAEMIIRDVKPKLAISIYHRPEDIIEIPELLLQYRSDYQFYLRHYSLHAYDTVLYAF